MQILVIGPFPEPIFGVSLSNMVLTNGLIKKGLKVKTINTSSSNTFDSVQGEWNFRKLSFLKHYLQLYKVLTSDVIYCTTGQTFFGILKYAPFVLLAKVLNRKSIVHVKGGYLKASYENMSYLKKKISKVILQLYSKGIVLSNSLKPLLEEFLDSKNIFVQHNFIQHSLIIPEKEVFKLKSFDSVKIIYLSNLIPEKGRLVQCGFCDRKWHFVKTQFPKEVKVENSTSFSDVLDNYNDIEKPSSDTSEDVDNDNKSSNREKSTSFIKIFIVILISIVALVVIIDTFKYQISNVFPNIEVIFQNLYETLTDIKLFIKDLL